MGIFQDILGTLRTTFKIAKGTLSTSGLTAAQTFTFPDLTGTIALNSQYRLLIQAAIAEGATTPNPGAAGCWAWSTTLSGVVFWDGTRWRKATPGITVSTTAPANPATGQVWVDTN
jgi:hypothetical protein